jgi:hypothetical protein
MNLSLVIVFPLVIKNIITDRVIDGNGAQKKIIRSIPRKKPYVILSVII